MRHSNTRTSPARNSANDAADDPDLGVRVAPGTEAVVDMVFFSIFKSPLFAFRVFQSRAADGAAYDLDETEQQ